jgi:hypothetical protein
MNTATPINNTKITSTVKTPTIPEVAEVSSVNGEKSSINAE